MNRRQMILALLFLASCEEPKNPSPCTGSETWPDPCAERFVEKRTTRDAGPLMSDDAGVGKK